MSMLIAPYGFKGTLDAAEAAHLIAHVVAGRMPDTERILLPLGDGGRGTTRAIVGARGGAYLTVDATDASGQVKSCTVGVVGDEGVMEAAEAVALADVPAAMRHPGRLTTRGVGELLLALAGSGSRSISIGLGDTATHDCGIGMASAVGFRFLDERGSLLDPVGESLGRIAAIDGELRRGLRDVEITVLCDVMNPLLGPDGAALLFAGQKGATDEEARALEEGGKRFAEIVAGRFGRELDAAPGAGAAGGLGAGLMTFLGARTVSGADAVLDAVGFDDLLGEADLVITGEGRVDRKTLLGKGTGCVARRAARAGVRCVIVAGGVEGDRAALERELGATIVELGGEPGEKEKAAAIMRSRLQVLLP
jgi:glycerate kinase